MTHSGNLIECGCELVNFCLPCLYLAHPRESIGGRGVDILIHFIEANDFHCRLWLEAVQLIEELHQHSQSSPLGIPRALHFNGREVFLEYPFFIDIV